MRPPPRTAQGTDTDTDTARTAQGADAKTAQQAAGQTHDSVPLWAWAQDSLTHEELAAGFVVGDEGCLTAAHHRWGARVYDLAWHSLGDARDAETPTRRSHRRHSPTPPARPTIRSSLHPPRTPGRKACERPTAARIPSARTDREGAAGAGS